MAEGTPYYLDHNQGITTWEHPELPPYPTAPPKCAKSEVWAGFRDMCSFGTARCALAPPCLSTGTRSDCHVPHFPGACARGGGGGGLCVGSVGRALLQFVQFSAIIAMSVLLPSNIF